MSVTRQAVTYASYLKVPELLALQVERSAGADGPEHDELLFIVIHQVYELWFKQVRHELLAVQRALESGDTDTALHLLNRVLKILKTLVAQVDVLETMTPLQFLSFRDRLESASGFQSGGFRQVEALLGLRDPASARAQPEASEARRAIEEDQAGPSVWDSFLAYLGQRGHAVPADATTPDERVQEIVVAVYRGDPDAALVAERLVDLDEGVQEWRYRHVKMVERTIGTKARHGRVERRGVPAHRRSSGRRSPTYGRSARGSDRAPSERTRTATPGPSQPSVRSRYPVSRPQASPAGLPRRPRSVIPRIRWCP